MVSSQRALQTNGKLFSNGINGRKSKNIQTNSKASILIKVQTVQCVIYQWIRLDKLYKVANGKLFPNFDLCLSVSSVNQGN